MNELSPPGVVNALDDPWQAVLAVTLAANALLLVGHRAYRYRKGGPKADLLGGTVLGSLLLVTAALVMNDVSWARWPALIYGSLFAVVVMPIWTLAVLIPLPPGALDYAFTGLYEGTLVAVVVASLLA